MITNSLIVEIENGWDNTKKTKMPYFYRDP